VKLDSCENWKPKDKWFKESLGLLKKLEIEVKKD
tara:strand:+ start:52710 stop:52811 length:102 start_codon:yes stop_codon:yes gene_type:complete